MRALIADPSCHQAVEVDAKRRSEALGQALLVGAGVMLAVGQLSYVGRRPQAAVARAEIE